MSKRAPELWCESPDAKKVKGEEIPVAKSYVEKPPHKVDAKRGKEPPLRESSSCVGQSPGDGEDSSDSESESGFVKVKAAEKHQKENAADILATFIRETFVVEFLSASGRRFLLHGIQVDPTDYESSTNAWPFCFFCEESNVVMGTMVDVTLPEEPRLVALWAFNPPGSESNQYILEGSTEECWEFCSTNEDTINSDGPWNHAFSVSSGDETVSDLLCPLLSSPEGVRALAASPLKPPSTTPKEKGKR